MEVYDRATRAVPRAERISVYDLYVARASEFFGVGKVSRRLLPPLLLLLLDLLRMHPCSASSRPHAFAPPRTHATHPASLHCPTHLRCAALPHCSPTPLIAPHPPPTHPPPTPMQVREIYESAIEAEPPHDLPDTDCLSLCTRYAALERKLGEVDRARAIYTHASHMADPRRAKDFWSEWNQFEVGDGRLAWSYCTAQCIAWHCPVPSAACGLVTA
jgi:hypothetical protein